MLQSLVYRMLVCCSHPLHNNTCQHCHLLKEWQVCYHNGTCSRQPMFQLSIVMRHCKMWSLMSNINQEQGNVLQSLTEGRYCIRICCSHTCCSHSCSTLIYIRVRCCSHQQQMDTIKEYVVVIKNRFSKNDVLRSSKPYQMVTSDEIILFKKLSQQLHTVTTQSYQHNFTWIYTTV